MLDAPPLDPFYRVPPPALGGGNRDRFEG